MKNVTRIFVLASMLLLACIAQGAQHEGFTAGTGISLSFDKNLYRAYEDAVVTITINGTVEPESDGEVLLINETTGEEYNCRVGENTINAPGVTGTYRFSASISVHTSTDPEDCSSHVIVTSNYVDINVFDVTMSLSRPVIAAGGINSNIHTSEISVTVLPTTMIGNINFTLSTDYGDAPDATLQSAQVVLNDGIAHNVIQSGDKVENLVVTASFNDISIGLLLPVVECEATWSIPDVLPCNGVDTVPISIVLTAGDEPVDQHNIEWSIAQIYNLDGDLVYDSDTGLDLRQNGHDYGWILTSNSQTDATGTASTTYHAGNMEALKIVFEAKDTSIVLP